MEALLHDGQRIISIEIMNVFQMAGESNDDYDENWRDLKFGWMKFQTFKNAKFIPGFIHPPDEDGRRLAKWIVATGSLSSKKKEYFDFNENLPENQKERSQKSALRKFNEKFVCDFK